MPNWSSGTVQTNGASLFYHRTGGDKPPVVMAHGFTDNGLCWTHVAQGLEAEYDVVVYDARGHGRSSPAAPAAPLLAPATDLIELCAALGLARPRMVGHSMGAVTVAVAAAQQPALAHSVVLVDPPVCLDHDARAGSVRPPLDEEHWAEWRGRVLAQRHLPREELIAACRAESPGWPAIEQVCWADAHREVDPGLFDIPHLMHGAWQRELPKVTCPLLLIIGEPAHGALVSPEAAAALAGDCKSGRYVTIPGAGHSVHRDRYEEFMRALLSFLASP